ncbi:MAG: glucose 1-dehydrogenase [Chloroflexi bacterium]|nr:glucose 1-dehydrogenase [Chloroflexota bacterium]
MLESRGLEPFPFPVYYPGKCGVIRRLVPLALCGGSSNMNGRYSLFDLSGKVALVTGAAGGIGERLSLGFAEFGADVVLIGRHQEALEKVAEGIRGLGRQVLTVPADVLDQSQVADMTERVRQKFGRIDILANCAGTHINKFAEEITVEEWDHVISLNMKGTFLPCQSVGRMMIQQRQGKIINISSVRGQLGIHAGYSAYCASKAGVNLLTKQLATEWAKHNINVNAIAPTFIRTPLVEPLLADKEFYQRLVNRIPLGRVGAPDDLLGAAVFLASDASNFVTGHVLYVDGGVTACQ